jgi:SNF family Na+-dependent transporter
MVRRIGINLYYLNSIGFARSEVLLGSLGLIIFELGLPRTCTETAKIFKQMDYKINKYQPMSKFLLSTASYTLLDEPEKILEAYGTRD